MAIKIQIIVTTIMMKDNSINELVKGTLSKPEQRTHKNSPIDCDGAQLTNAQCHMVTYIHIFILINLKYKIWIYIWNQAGKNNSIISANIYIYTYIYMHVCIYIYISPRAYFNYLECGYDAWNAYLMISLYGPEPKSSGGKTSSNPQVSVLIPRPAS